jgi:hypothetical protein
MISDERLKGLIAYAVALAMTNERAQEMTPPGAMTYFTGNPAEMVELFGAVEVFRQRRPVKVKKKLVRKKK